MATSAFAHTSVDFSSSTQSSGVVSGTNSVLDNRGQGNIMRSNIIGTVTVINGNTITVVGNKAGWGKGEKDANAPQTTPTPTTYTVDASNAIIIKNGATSTVANIIVGDKVKIHGAITDANIVATIIRDNTNRTTESPKPKPSPSPLIPGNGQPIIAGSVTAINGLILTVTNKSGITYTVDASTAKIQNNRAFSDIIIGDNVIVQGVVNGTSVTASSIIVIQGATPSLNAEPNNNGNGVRGNFFGGIGRFFQRLFGF